MNSSNHTEKKQIRSCRMTKDKSQEVLKSIARELVSHIGQPAILFVKEGRDMTPYFVKITGRSTAIYNCYNSDGTFRCHLTLNPNIVSIMTGDQKIVYFDEDI